MLQKLTVRWLLFGALWLLSLSLSAAQDAKSQIAAEITRLEQSLKASPIIGPDLAPVALSASQNLSEASAALQSGKLYLSLERLLQAENLLHGARFTLEKSEAVKSGYPAFEGEWKNISQSVASVNQQSRAKEWSSMPAAIRALAEASLARSIPLLDGGRGFALSTKPADGLFYLGEARGEAAFASFAATLSLKSNSPQFPLRSFLPELQALQRKTNKTFKPPRSVQLHQRFIALNSALKLAQELDAQKSYAGSLYQYLEATRHFAMLDAPPVEADDQPSLKGTVIATLKRYASSKRDDSILQVFLERAVSQIAHPDGSASSADEWRSAKVILDDVVPAYLVAQKPAKALPQSDAKTVQVTLVRWPYT